MKLEKNVNSLSALKYINVFFNGLLAIFAFVWLMIVSFGCFLQINESYIVPTNAFNAAKYIGVVAAAIGVIDVAFLATKIAMITKTSWRDNLLRTILYSICTLVILGLSITLLVWFTSNDNIWNSETYINKTIPMMGVLAMLGVIYALDFKYSGYEKTIFNQTKSIAIASIALAIILCVSSIVYFIFTKPAESADVWKTIQVRFAIWALIGFAQAAGLVFACFAIYLTIIACITKQVTIRTFVALAAAVICLVLFAINVSITEHNDMWKVFNSNYAYASLALVESLVLAAVGIFPLVYEPKNQIVSK